MVPVEVCVCAGWGGVGITLLRSNELYKRKEQKTFLIHAVPDIELVW